MAKVERDLSRIVGVPMLLRDEGFTAGSRVVGIGLADGVPISLEHAMFPAEVVAASADEAAILSIEPGAHPISITRTTRDARGFAFE